jgi:hypothetical protein
MPKSCVAQKYRYTEEGAKANNVKESETRLCVLEAGKRAI